MKNNRFLPRVTDCSPVQGRFLLTERPARHLKWSAAIAGGFLRTDGVPQWRFNRFTFGLRAKRIFSLIRQALNLQVSWPRQEQPVIINNFLKQQVLAARNRRPLAETSARPCTLVPPSVFFRHSQLRQTLSRTEKSSEHHIWLQPSERTGQAWLAPSSRPMSRGMRWNGIRQEANLSEMTTRITHRLRRVEETPLSPEPRLVAAAPVHSFAENFESPARKRRYEVNPVHPSQSGASLPVSSGVNVVQLTDEVMRQIDRKLVAVRERMGKI